MGTPRVNCPSHISQPHVKKVETLPVSLNAKLQASFFDRLLPFYIDTAGWAWWCVSVRQIQEEETGRS